MARLPLILALQAKAVVATPTVGLLQLYACGPSGVEICSFTLDPFHHLRGQGGGLLDTFLIEKVNA